MSPNSKFLWLGGALVFLVFLGFVQLGHLAVHATTDTLTENDVVVLFGGAAFAAFSMWFVER